MGRGALAWIWWYELGYLTTDRQEKGAWVRFGLYGVSARRIPAAVPDEITEGLIPLNPV